MQQRDKITAKAWILMDSKHQSYIRGVNTQQKRQIASLTKMYTLYACLSLNKMLAISPENTYLKIFDVPISGTIADLIPNQYLSIIDLYYGLMLPSGNDAACVLATYYGGWLVNSKNSTGISKIVRRQSLGDRIKYSQLYSKKFVQFMNNFVVKSQLNHSHTHFQNPHGLPDKGQFSNVWELAQASLKFQKNQIFRQICNTKVYRGNYFESQNVFQWKNTNVLLHEGYIGTKTGYTMTAGGCLSSLTEIRLNRFDSQPLLIVVLGSSSTSSRFTDTKLIVEEHQQFIQMMKL